MAGGAQDDNLFCPHPKDYMDLRERSTWEEIREFVVKQGFTAATVSDEIGENMEENVELKNIRLKKGKGSVNCS